MYYIVYRSCPDGFLYLKQEKRPGQPYSWTHSYVKCTQFRDDSRAQNFVSGISALRDDTDIKIAPKDEIINLEAARNSISGAYSSDGTENHATIEDADEFCNKILDVSRQFCDILERVEWFRHIYCNTVNEADLELEDLLHKIELSNLDVVRGYQIYKQLQSSRIKRRHAKDMDDFLCMFKEANLMSSAVSFRKMLDAYENTIANRQYRPRILDNLFPLNSPDQEENIGA